jgi:hypothetical protein
MAVQPTRGEALEALPTPRRIAADIAAIADQAKRAGDHWLDATTDRQLGEVFNLIDECEAAIAGEEQPCIYGLPRYCSTCEANRYCTGSMFEPDRR